MQANIDMNHFKITNLGSPSNPNDAVRLSDIEELIVADGSDLAILATSTGASLVGSIQTGAGAVASTVQTELRLQGLRPEQFGAVGDGTTNDAAAILATIVAQQSTGIPITLTPGATYGIGDASWTGLNITLTRNLEIFGNGATIKLLAIPTQSARYGSGKSVFLMDCSASGYRVTIRDLNYNSNGIRAYAFDTYRGQVLASGCNFTNGGMSAAGFGDAAIAFYSNACDGIWLHKNTCDEFGYFAFSGHGAASTRSSNVFIVNNIITRCYRENSSDRGVGIHGVVHNFFYAFNTISGCFSGISMPGNAATSSICENGVIIGNRIDDTTAHGIQTDVFGAIKNKNLLVQSNSVNDVGVNAASLYMISIDNLRVFGNQCTSCEFGLFIDNCIGFTVSDNDFDATGSATPVTGISATGQVGTISDGTIHNNKVTGYAANIGVGGAGTVTRVNVTVNKTKGGARGLYIQEASAGDTTDIWVDSNDFAGGHSTSDITNATTNGQVGVQYGQNRFATASGVTQILLVSQPAPTAKIADATLTIAEIFTSIITVTSASAVALTLPSGALTDAGVGKMASGQSFDWNVINLGSASGAVTMTSPGADHTYVGNATVAISTSAQFRTRKTATNTFITYRIS